MEPKIDDGSRPSLHAQVAALLARAFENNLLIRLGAVIVMVWVWLTLLSFTLSITREVAGVAAGVGIYPGLSSSYVVGAILTGAAALLVVIPAVFVWNELLRLTRILGRIVITTVYWDSQDDEPGMQMLRLQEMIRDIANTFVRWFRIFAVTWIVVLIVNTFGTVAASILLLLEPR